MPNLISSASPVAAQSIPWDELAAVCLYSDQKKVDCQGNDYYILEFGFKSFPACLFVVTGLVRYFAIKDYGQGNFRFSTLFKTCLLYTSPSPRD